MSVHDLAIKKGTKVTFETSYDYFVSFNTANTDVELPHMAL
jgi:hypothetical protein